LQELRTDKYKREWGAGKYPRKDVLQAEEGANTKACSKATNNSNKGQCSGDPTTLKMNLLQMQRMRRQRQKRIVIVLFKHSGKCNSPETILSSMKMPKEGKRNRSRIGENDNNNIYIEMQNC
jgi:hypothetical protein